MIRFAAADAAVVAIYFILVLIVGMGTRRRSQAAEDYLVAGRSVTLPAFVATLVATWYGGILGVGEYSYSYGLASWTVFGLPYYVFALVFALFLAGRVRQASLYTIPDRIAADYGKLASVLAAVCAFIMVSPAPYVLMLGVLMSLFTSLPLNWCVLVGTVLSVFYVSRSGLRTDIRVNILQFAMMFIGFGVLLPVAYLKLGGLEYLRQSLPHAHLTPSGGNGPQVILVWFLIAVWTLVDPGFHQRCYAARTPAVARNGILVAICFWFVFDFLTTFTGLYARAALPELTDPKMSYPLLAEMLLSPGLKGLFYVGMLATIMSTVLSYTFLGAATIGRDVIWRATGEAAEDRIPSYTRIGLLATGLLAVVLAIRVPSVVRLWYSIGTVCVPGLLAPVLGSYFMKRKMTHAWCVACILSGCLVSLGWLLYGQARGGVCPLGVEPMLPGLAASFILLIVSRKQEAVS